MEALNAVAGLTPAYVFCEKRREPRNKSSTSPLKFPNFSIHNPSQNLSERNFQGGLVFFSSLFNTGFAGALTYEEALQQSVNASSSREASDFLDVGGILDGITNFATENPLILGGGAVIVAVPLILYQIFGGKPKPWGAEPARRAYGKLADDGSAQLLDIRPSGEVKKVGSPDIRGLKKKPVSVVYKGDDKLGFLKKLSFKFKEPENTTLIILDKFDGNSELVAELVTANGYKAAYAIKDGAEGPRGWMNSGLPWILPKKTPSLDLSNLTDAIGGWLGDSEALSVAVGIVAATGLGVLTFTEVETVLQLLGSAALLQFISTKLLFAEDRKQTLLQVDEFLNTKVAAKQLLDDVKDIGKALLPSPVIGKALPAPAEASPVAADDTVQKAEATAPEPVPQINSVPKTEVKAESLRGTPRPLSPYPYYPDFKPPTSPTPTQP